MATNKDKRECPNCHGPMILISKETRKARKGSNYSIRKYKCNICDIEEPVYAGGFKDEVIDVENAKKHIEKMFNQMEENQND